MSREHLIELAKANGFSSVTEAITAARQSRAKIDQLTAAMQKACDLLSTGHNARLCLEAALEPQAMIRECALSIENEKLRAEIDRLKTENTRLKRWRMLTSENR